MQVLRKAFTQALDPTVTRFVASIEEDKELIAADLQGSMAHCAMLAEQQLITQAEADSIQEGLANLTGATARGEFELKVEFEDVHMNVEKQLEALIGKSALRLHTARSRNDQVALDFRLYVADQIGGLTHLISSLKAALVRKAAENSSAVMPGYTHLQRAQPVHFAHALLAFHQMFSRDLERFQQALGRTKVSPLGAGAQAGTALAINPATTAAALGMPHVFENSIDAVTDRDFAAEFLMAACLSATHLSQLAETLIIWNTSEFGFVKFADNVTTSSSLMPQKKNPDPVELVRGKAGLAVGELVNLLVTLKGLPLGYNRDLQETKAPVIRVARSLSSSLEVMTIVLSNTIIQPERMLESASDDDLMATDLVEYLVLKGVPFRTAHEAVASAVQTARSSGSSLSQLSIDSLRDCCPAFDPDVYALFDPIKSAMSKMSHGGTGQVGEILQSLRATM